MILALLLLLAGMPVGDVAPPSATPTTREPMSPGERAALIKESIADGIAARRRGDHERAYRYFRLANDVAQPPTLQTLSQLGLAECSVHKWAEAEKHLTEAIAMIKAGTLGPEKTTLASSLEEAQRHVGVLHLNGTPGATIRADGVLVGRLPYEGVVRLSEGTRHMLATAPGYSPEGLDVEIKGDHEFEATFILHPVVVSKPQTLVPPVPILEDEAPKPVPTKTILGLGLLSLGAAPATFGALLLRYDGEYLRGGVLLGVGAALMAEGFNLYWRGIHSEKSSMSVVLAPSSVTLNGQF
jgi:hypothetical protein